MKHLLRGILVIAAVLMLAACGTQPSADPVEITVQNISVTSGVLNIYPSYINSNTKQIIVGPAQGRVQVFGLPDVADGTIYNGIKAINWESGPGLTNLQLDVTQSTDFDFKIITGAGSTNIKTKWLIPAGVTTTITPTLDIKTGPGTHTVETDLESFGRNVNFTLKGVMGTSTTNFLGDLQFKEGSVNARANVDFKFFGSLGDKSELLIDNKAKNLTLNLTPRLMRESITKINGDDIANRATVNFNPFANGSGSIIAFEMKTRAPIINLNYNVTGSGRDDEIKLGLSSLTTATVTSNVNMNLYGGNDKLEMKYDGSSSNQNIFSGPINLRDGNDEAKLEYSGTATNSIALDCGTGIDKATGFTSVVNCEFN